MDQSNRKTGLLVGCGAALLVVIFLVSTYIGYYNEGVTKEAEIIEQYKQNQNAYSNFSLSIVEQLHVADAYAGKVADVIKAALEGRYGDDGSDAMVNAVKEAYPASLNSNMHESILQQIAAGRTEFKFDQNKLLSKVRGYNQELQQFWSGKWLAAAGYPKIKLEDYDIVLSGKTRKTFETKTDDGLFN